MLNFVDLMDRVSDNAFECDIFLRDGCDGISIDVHCDGIHVSREFPFESIRPMECPNDFMLGEVDAMCEELQDSLDALEELSEEDEEDDDDIE